MKILKKSFYHLGITGIIGSLISACSVPYSNIAYIEPQPQANLPNLVQFQSAPTLPTFVQPQFSTSFLQSYAHLANIKKQHIPLIFQAEQQATSAGKSVLRKARILALDKQAIIRGSCWNYLNTVFKQAQVRRNNIFTAKKDGGRYFNLNHLQAGDWIYHTNLSYHNVEHSGMFVAWVDKAKSKALMLSYAGQNRNKPARYKVYDISRTYNVKRPIL